MGPSRPAGYCIQRGPSLCRVHDLEAVSRLPKQHAARPAIWDLPHMAEIDTPVRWMRQGSNHRKLRMSRDGFQLATPLRSRAPQGCWIKSGGKA